MAYLTRFAHVNRPGIMGSDIVEGSPVKIINSGSASGSDLPKLILADQNETHNVFVVMSAMDDFSRPTDERMYTATWNTSISKVSGYGDPVQTRTLYDVAKSTLWNPTLKSGERAVAHRGVTFAVPSGRYNDTAGIKIPGSLFRVGANGLWDTTSTAAEAVGTVEQYNAANGVLILNIEH